MQFKHQHEQQPERPGYTCQHLHLYTDGCGRKWRGAWQHNYLHNRCSLHFRSIRYAGGELSEVATHGTAYEEPVT